MLTTQSDTPITSNEPLFDSKIRNAKLRVSVHLDAACSCAPESTLPKSPWVIKQPLIVRGKEVYKLSESGPIGFETDVVQHSGEVVVFVAGELDLSTADQLSGTLEQVMASSPSIVVDLSKTTFVDSSGLSVLIQAKQALDKANGSLKLRAPQPQTIMAMRAAGLDEFLPIEGT